MNTQTQNTDIEIFQRRWDGLRRSNKLKLLELAELSEADRELLVRIKGDLDHPDFVKRHMLLARFKEAAREETMERAAQITPEDWTKGNLSYRLPRSGIRVGRALKSDIKKINRLICSWTLGTIEKHVGVYYHPIATDLHADRQAAYITNVAIGARFIDNDKVDADPDLQELVQKARLEDDAQALTALKDQGLLPPGDAGGLYLIGADALHVSGDFPVGADGKPVPTPIAFFRAYAY